MNKNYLLLLPLLVLITNAFAFEKQAFGGPNKELFLNCFEIPELTVEHPRCESPDTGTIEVTYPVSETYQYSIDGVNYQLSPFFDLVLPGIYHVRYKDESGCISQLNTVQVDPAMPHAIIDLDPQSSLIQMVCLNSAIAPISYTLGGTATQATVSGLPAGLSAHLSNGVFTISGTVLTPGIYNFSIVSNGACQAQLNGIVTVRLNAALAWISSSGPRNQTLCRHTPIVPVRHIVANGATGAVASGLPPGLAVDFTGGIYTISGTPGMSGIYNYTITTTGGCSVAAVGGVLTINAAPVLDIQCNNASSSDSMSFEWQAIPGVTAYNYSYSISNGAIITGVKVTPNFTVPGVLPGQSVAFSVNGINVPGLCFAPQSISCTMEVLGVGAFYKRPFGCYPNPVKDILYVESESESEKITVFNAFGQKVMAHNPSVRNAALDVSHLQKGVYFLRVGQGSNECLRFLKD